MTARTRTDLGKGARLKRFPLVGGLLVSMVLLGGCQLPAFYGYRGSTKQAHDEFLLYAGTFIAAIVIGGITGLLMLWVIVRYRRKKGADDIPRQFQYHIPLELLYTVLPVIIVLVLFGFTVVAENRIDAVAADPAVTVNTYAFQWGWEFDYQGKNVSIVGETLNDPDPVGLNGAACAPAADCLGPGLVVPAGQTVQINLRSRDTIHGFYVPKFNFSRYAQPGVLNQFDLTVYHPGIYRAQCTQFCGLYHSIMFFHVVALPPSQFATWIASEQQPTGNAAGQVPQNSQTAGNAQQYPSGGSSKP